MLTANLPLGYHRDLQLLKEVLFPAIADLDNALGMADYMLRHIEVREDILESPVYELYVQRGNVNNLVLAGCRSAMAYRKVELTSKRAASAPQKERQQPHARGEYRQPVQRPGGGIYAESFLLDRVRPCGRGRSGPCKIIPIAWILYMSKASGR